MTTAELGEYFMWKGKLVEVIGINEGHRAIMFQSIEKKKCPHCNEELEVEKFEVIESSPLFQENAEPIRTIVKTK